MIFEELFKGYYYKNKCSTITTLKLKISRFNFSIVNAWYLSILNKASFSSFMQQLLEIVPPLLVDKFGEEKQKLNFLSTTKQNSMVKKSSF